MVTRLVQDGAMMSWPALIRPSVLGLAYFVAASLAVSLTRYDGGVAFLWVASSLLIAELMSRPRRPWGPPIVACALGSFFATGLFGFGWPAAGPFVAVNIAEAMVAAWTLRRFARSLQPLGSLHWLMHFVGSVAVVAPLIAAALAAAALVALGKPPGSAFISFFTGHALGNITFTPLALLFARGNLARTMKAVRRRDASESVSLLLLVLLTCVVVFRQSQLPLLFLPVLPIILVIFRIGRGGAAVSIALLALIGGGATIAGFGPIRLIGGSIGTQLQFFQFYLAATVLTVLPIVADLQNRSRLHRDMRLSEERYRLMAEHSSDILFHLDADGRIRYVSPSVLQLGGHDSSALIGRNSRILIVPEHLERVREAHAETLAKPGETQTYDYLGLTAAGSRRWFETHARAIIDEQGEIDGVISIVRDISARKANELRLTEAALTDPLTGLANRRAFRSAVERKRLGAGIGETDCVAVLDIDHFKVVNDSFGHAAGDEVLRGFARVARRMVRDGDVLARIGGEEFAIFFPDTSVEHALLICERLRAEMARAQMRVGSSLIGITVSGGVATLGSESIDEALNVADLALYHAKRNGRDQFTLAA